VERPPFGVYVGSTVHEVTQVVAIAFIVIAVMHPYLGLPDTVVAALRNLDIVLLAAGRDALVLGTILFGYLIAGGGVANWLIQRAFSSASVFSS
jgi:uncharacterized membrane protein YadS